MLRSRRFTRVERGVAWAMGGLTISAGIIGFVLAVAHGKWRPGLCGLGVVALGLLYARAAWLGRPLVWADLRRGTGTTPKGMDYRYRP